MASVCVHSYMNVCVHCDSPHSDSESDLGEREKCIVPGKGEVPAPLPFQRAAQARPWASITECTVLSPKIHRHCSFTLVYISNSSCSSVEDKKTTAMGCEHLPARCTPRPEGSPVQPEPHTRERSNSQPTPPIQITIQARMLRPPSSFQHLPCQDIPCLPRQSEQTTSSPRQASPGHPQLVWGHQALLFLDLGLGWER